ncbi:MAG: hypothetical protein Q3M24_18995 [Candidatus Electrothrix aestuarii]|uniref:Uncharacterized protein n=1 Tax=Candidatus Electrothrix aestuarii TaxID=3062594 RepID=A0AAU8LU24_9BACT
MLQIGVNRVDSIDPKIGIAAKTASGSFVSLRNTQSASQCLDALLTVENLGIPSPATSALSFI